MMRRVIAGIVLGLIVMGAAAIVSRGFRSPGAQPHSSGSQAAPATITAALPVH